MNELTLSNDLNVITAEINSYKQVAGQAIFEIGKRLKHVKENDLVHGEFGKWLESIDMSHTQANRFMKVYKEIPQAKLTNVGQFSFNALYEIATLPPEEREKTHTLASGETKTVDEMAVRELRETKRALNQAKKSEEIALKRLEELESKTEPVTKTVEKIVEVVPQSMQDELNEKDKQLQALKDKMNLLKSQIKYTNEQEKHEQEIKALQYEADKTVLVTKLKMDEFLQEVAFTAFRKGAIAASSSGTRKKLEQGVEELKAFCAEMELVMTGRIDLTKRASEVI